MIFHFPFSIRRAFSLPLGGLGWASFVLLLFLIAANLFCGSVDIPVAETLRILTSGEATKASWQYIILDSRLPQTITALLCGASLAASGLLLQTAFRNPLAGPSILGITNGASLGVALVMLLTGGVLSLSGSDIHFTGVIAIIAGAFLGALIVIAILLAFATVVSNHIMLLIVGIMVSYLTSSIVSILNFFANADNIQSFVLWGMGSFSDVSNAQLPWFSAICLLGILCALLLIKPLNALLLGDNYAENLGINTRSARRQLLIVTGILTAVTTAFCGPIAFIGLAVPHIARMITKTSNHAILLPATMLCGANIALLCNIICTMPHNMIMPINAITPLFGAPVIIYVLTSKLKIEN
ncbi:MAG: iron ABC transporter permease [Prevotella sp.]|nr:iron ABC transporter permease [Candidatus Prevotella equi]